MRTLTRLSFAIVALACLAAAARAQTQAQTPEPEWVTVSPAGESFDARMPKHPVAVAQHVSANGLDASGTRYAAAADERTTFIIWSMKGSNAAGPLGAGDYKGSFFPGGVAYLDAIDELAWELLITPELERLKRLKIDPARAVEINVGMTYGGEFELSGLPARRYAVGLEKERGLVYVSAEGSQVYVVAALGASENDPRLKKFLDSFALKSAATRTAVVVDSSGAGVGIGPGRGSDAYRAVPDSTGVGGATVDYSKPFKPGEVLKKAAITTKPEPGFTEQARKFNVTGVVRLRAILAATGEVTSIFIVKGLPHGLTEKAVAAAKGIRFEPAQKDGRAVSQYVTLEYNFNIY